MLSLRRYLAAVAAVTGALAPPWSASAERAHPTATMVRINGVRFDIPFLHKALQLPQETTAAWLFKTTDILEAARLGVFGPAAQVLSPLM